MAKKESGCNVAALTEPHLVLVAHDNFTQPLLEQWIKLAVRMNVPKPKIDGVRRILSDVKQWRTKNPVACKLPD